MATAKMKELVKEWNELREEEKRTKEKKNSLRGVLLKEITKTFPDKTRSARLEVGDYNVIRSAVPKFTWDFATLQKVLGNDLYEEVTKVKTTVDEKKMGEKIDEGIIDRKKLYKACDVKYEERLLVNANNKELKEDNTRSFVEVMDF